MERYTGVYMMLKVYDLIGIDKKEPCKILNAGKYWKYFISEKEIENSYYPGLCQSQSYKPDFDTKPGCVNSPFVALHASDEKKV